MSIEANLTDSWCFTQYLETVLTVGEGMLSGVFEDSFALQLYTGIHLLLLVLHKKS